MATPRALPVAAALPLLLAQLHAAGLAIDHATVAGANLAAMRDAFTAATGIPTQYGGRHTNHATEMAVVSFPDGSYLELMGIVPDPDPKALDAHEWARFLRTNAGPCGFALRTSDLSAESARLRSRGIPVAAAVAGGRTRPDGVRLRWETADVGPPPRGSLFPFLISDLTPRPNRVYPGGKPTTSRFRGVAAVVVGVRDLDKAVAEYRAAFALPAPERRQDSQFGATLASFKDTPIVLAQSLDAEGWLGRRVHQYGEGPCAILLASDGGLTGSDRSLWFGHSIAWTNEAKLGWRLGFEVLP